MYCSGLATGILSDGFVMRIDLNDIGTIAAEAGRAILKIYNDPLEQFVFTRKEDNSPLTLADKESHRIIVNGLSAIQPQMPILSEEGKNIPYEDRKHWEYYWCVDPLDGTKEFLNRNGEFTVNIALIHKNTPVIGVIYIPVTGDLYIGSAAGSFKTGADTVKTILKVDSKKDQWTAIGSRSHSSPGEVEFLSAYPVTNTISAGSSLKFCFIAEGKAHIYYRQGPTMEWDTAAGHAIALYSGAIITQPDGSPFLYNTPSLINTPFVCRIPSDF